MSEPDGTLLLLTDDFYIAVAWIVTAYVVVVASLWPLIRVLRRFGGALVDGALQHRERFAVFLFGW